MDPNMSEWLRAAETAYRAGDYAEATDRCRTMLERDPRSLPAVVLMGMIAHQEGRFNDAITHLQRAARLDGQCFEAFLWLGIAQRDRGDVSEAVTTLRQSLQIWPGNPTALNHLALAYLAQKNAANAIATLQRAIANRPDDADLHRNIAYAFQMQGDNEVAVSAFENSLKLDPTSLIALTSLGQLYLELTRRDDAIRVFRRAHEIAPDTARGQIQLARALREEGDFAGAEQALRRALELEPGSVDALEVVSNLMQQLGRFDEAVDVIDRAIELEPARNRLYFNRIYCRKATDDDRSLLAKLEQVSPADPSEGRYVHYSLAKAYNDLGQLPEAMTHYDQANTAMRALLGNREFERDIHRAEFDRKMATFTPEFFQRHLAAGSADETPVFIVGMIRSGTTLVEQILSSHPQVTGAGELLFWFQRAHELVSREGDRVNAPAIQKVQADYIKLLQGIDPDAARVTDKMPNNYMFLGQIHLAFPKARIIHCRRHPVDNCLSIYMTPYQIPLDFAHDKANIAFVYREYQRLMAHWEAVIPAENLLKVDYETLVADPEPSVRRMVDFVGLDWDEACLRPEDNDRAVKTPSMWQVRQPVYKTSTERWRKYEPWLGEFASLL
jgi:tetratricopeptide (TPR) repeat protein